MRCSRGRAINLRWMINTKSLLEGISDITENARTQHHVWRATYDLLCLLGNPRRQQLVEYAMP